MTIAFISDLHLTPERPESTQWFEQFMTRSVGILNTLYILGDLFEVWIGDDGRDTLGQRDAEQILKNTVDAGVQVFFMHGNRDFLVGEEFERRTGCTILADPTIIQLGGESVLLSHGDTLCIDDIAHQNARKTMLTSKWKFAFLEKPVDERMRFAQDLRTKSEKEKQVKSMEIMDVNQQYVEEVMRQHKVRLMIHGHTHRPAVHEFDLDGVIAKRYVLGDWYTQKSMLYYSNGSFALKSQESSG